MNEALMRAMFGGNDEEEKKEPMTDLQKEGLAEVLRERLDVFGVRHTFESRQLVRWKSGMSNRAKPRLGEPVIVVNVLEQPVFDSHERCNSGTYLFREPLDIIIGLLGSDGDFETYHVDSRRFEPYTGPGA